MFSAGTLVSISCSFESQSVEAGESFPGRMGVAASLNFFFMGIAVTFLDARLTRWFRVSTIATLAVVAITLLFFLYYFYGIEKFEPLARYFSISLHGVIAFLSLSGAVLLARPERDLVAAFLGKSPGAVVARRMLPAFLVVILLGWIRTIAYSTGWISQGFMTASFVLAILLLLGVLIWLTALSLNRTDKERRLVDLAQRRAENRLDLLFRVSELIRTRRDPYELSYAVAEQVGIHLDARRCLFNETDVERDLEIVHRDYCDGVASVAGEHRISEYSSITSLDMQQGKTVVNNDSKV